MPWTTVRIRMSFKVSPSGVGTSVPTTSVRSITDMLELIRSGAATTRSELSEQTRLGRGVVSRRLGELVDCALVAFGDAGPSNGGRSPRELRFRSETGRILVATLGATSVTAAITDLAGEILAKDERPWRIEHGPIRTFELVREMWAHLPPGNAPVEVPIWGIGIGVPGPVDFDTGRPASPPIMPGWDDFPIREELAAEFGAPVWVDNDANLMALGELRAGTARGERDAVFVKIGTGIGSGLIIGGSIHRGVHGSAGDIGHIPVVDDINRPCRCGRHGCLEAMAGGAAIAREAELMAADGRSPYLGEIRNRGVALRAEDVTEAAHRGDQACIQLLRLVGNMVGESLATVVNLVNPSLVVLGGGVTGAGDALLASIRQGIYFRSSPLASRDLRIVRSDLGTLGGAIGAAHMVADELFSRRCLSRWIGEGSPVGRVDLAAAL